MKLEQIELPVNNPILADYLLEDTAIHSFFQYRYTDEAFVERANYLEQQHYNRQELVHVIRSYMTPFGLSEAIEENLLALQNGALTVVGGQQAGLLTGPLYSVHKAITVILLAKEQGKKLGKAVVPLFWIAGEDHDIEEINHTFTIQQSEVKKRGYGERSKRKTMASTTELNREATWEFIKNVFKDYGETAYTAALLNDLRKALDHSKTFTDFFTYLMNDLFKAHGLLMIDAAYPLFRQYESAHFAKLIKQSTRIAEVVTAKEEAFAKAGYGNPICANIDAANLFYVQDGERYLLERRHHQFVNLNANIKLTEDDLLAIAEEKPQLLSNNVVTRPLMQEMNLPVLAFVGGPGELAYWATLKDAFDLLGLQMPIFAPRLNITFITRQVNQLLQEKAFTIADVFEGKEQQEKADFLTSIQDEEAQQYLTEMEQFIMGKYDELTSYLEGQQFHLEKIANKNKENHLKQFNYFSQKLKQAVETKHLVAIQQFDKLTSELMPNGGYQERSFAPYQYLNMYGPSLIDDILAKDWCVANKHIIVYL